MLSKGHIQFKILLVLATGLFLSACASSIKDYDKSKMETNLEFEQAVTIKTIEEPKAEPEPPKKEKKKKPVKKEKKPKKTATKKVEKKKPAPKKEVKKEEPPKKEQKIAKKEPDLEDKEGFNGRRPIQDPFNVGEEIVLDVTYFAVEAGAFTFRTKKFAEVNGKKSYHFEYNVKTSPLFGLFYEVDDTAETFVDYETMIPYSYAIHVKESKQVRETRSYFDWKKLRGYVWDKKKRKGRPLEEKKYEWDILPWSQNVFSVAYYLRTFKLQVGRTYKVRVAHEGKNMIMSAKVLRKEKLKTAVGTFQTYVVKPSFKVGGIFKPTGDNLLWLTADKRKFIVRIESKIKIGTIVGKIKKLVR